MKIKVYDQADEKWVETTAEISLKDCDEIAFWDLKNAVFGDNF